LGDLSLIGRPRGHLIAVKPSHSANCELARLISAQMRKPLLAAQTFSPPPAPAHAPGTMDAATRAEYIQDGATLDILQVMRILPHRYPFLMVDKVTKIEGNKITAIKNVSVNEPYFQGHFPTIRSCQASCNWKPWRSRRDFDA